MSDNVKGSRARKGAPTAIPAGETKRSAGIHSRIARLWERASARDRRSSVSRARKGAPTALWQWSAALSVVACLAAGPSLAAPTVTRTADAIVVSNAEYTATISQTNGNLQRLESKAFGGGTVLVGGFTYADIGVLKEGSHPFLGSTHSKAKATVTVTSDANRVAIGAEGPMCLEDGTQPPGPKWRYRFRYVFDDSPVVHLTAGVQTDTARAPAGGFLATTLSFAKVNEWFADLDPGMQWVDLGPESGRCFEAHVTPLRPERRRLGLINHDNGAVVLLDHLESDPPGALEDVILHSGGTGQVTAFLNWLGGQAQTRFEPGRWVDLRCDLSLTGELPE